MLQGVEALQDPDQGVGLGNLLEEIMEKNTVMDLVDGMLEAAAAAAADAAAAGATAGRRKAQERVVDNLLE